MIRMSETFAWTFPGGRLKREIQSVTVADNTTKTITVTVPAGKLWRLLGVRMINPDNVSRTLKIYVYDENDNLLCILLERSGIGANSYIQWPCTLESSSIKANPAIQLLKGGDYLKCIWAAGGASSGGTASAGLIIEYLELEQ